MLYTNWTVVLLPIAAICHVLTVRAAEDVKSWYGRHGRDTREADREHDFSRSKNKCYICFTADHLNSRPYAKLRMMAKKSYAYLSSTFVASNKGLIEHAPASRVVAGQILIMQYSWNVNLFEFKPIYL